MISYILVSLDIQQFHLVSVFLVWLAIFACLCSFHYSLWLCWRSLCRENMWQIFLVFVCDEESQLKVWKAEKYSKNLLQISLWTLDLEVSPNEISDIGMFFRGLISFHLISSHLCQTPKVVFLHQPLPSCCPEPALFFLPFIPFGHPQQKGLQGVIIWLCTKW